MYACAAIKDKVEGECPKDYSFTFRSDVTVSIDYIALTVRAI